MKKITLITLELIFLAVVAYVVSVRGLVIPSPALMVAFVLATMRLAHTISYNEVCEWLREPFCYVKPDSCKAGSDVHAIFWKGGFVEAIGGLLSCPSACCATWAALILYTVWALFPAFGTALVLVFAFAGGSEVLHYVTNYYEWASRLARVKSGSICPDEDN